MLILHSLAAALVVSLLCELAVELPALHLTTTLVDLLTGFRARHFLRRTKRTHREDGENCCSYRFSHSIHLPSFRVLRFNKGSAISLFSQHLRNYNNEQGN